MGVRWCPLAESRVKGILQSSADPLVLRSADRASRRTLELERSAAPVLNDEAGRSASKSVIRKHFAPSRSDISGFSLARHIGRLEVPFIGFRR